MKLTGIRKIILKISHWAFETVAGKIVIGWLAMFGVYSIFTAAIRYDHALDLVKDAKLKAEIAAEDWRGNLISRNVVFKEYSRVRGKGYVENLFEGKRTIENVEWVRTAEPSINEQDSLAVFSRYEKGRGSHKGYLDIYSGRVAITDQFKHAWNFKNGQYAVVCLDNDSLYVINRSGEIVSNRGFKLSTQLRFGFMFNDDLCIMEGNNGKFGIIDPIGDWALTPEYDWVLRNPLKGDYKVMVGEKHGIIDKEMNELIPIKYAYIYFESPIDNPCENEKWHRNTAYWADNGEGELEFFDGNGNLLKIAKWER